MFELKLKQTLVVYIKERKKKFALKNQKKKKLLRRWEEKTLLLLQSLQDQLYSLFQDLDWSTN